MKRNNGPGSQSTRPLAAPASALIVSLVAFSAAASTPIGTPLECFAKLTFPGGRSLESPRVRTVVLDPADAPKPDKPNARMDFAGDGMFATAFVYVEDDDATKNFMKAELWRDAPDGAREMAYAAVVFDHLDERRWLGFGNQATRSDESRDNAIPTVYVECVKKKVPSLGSEAG